MTMAAASPIRSSANRVDLVEDVVGRVDEAQVAVREHEHGDACPGEAHVIAAGVGRKGRGERGNVVAFQQCEGLLHELRASDEFDGLTPCGHVKVHHEAG